MKVYVVILHREEDTSAIIGIFKTKEHAIVFLYAQSNDVNEYIIEEHEVQE